MLEQQPWIRFANQVQLEWEQCRFEGKDVEQYRILCEETSKLENQPESLAAKIETLLHNAPQRTDFTFNEPSDWEGIAQEKPLPTRRYENTLDDRTLADKLAGAWTGRIAGCLLGKPVEGFKRDKLWPLLQETGNYPMHKYIIKADFTDDLISRLSLNTNACWADTIGGCAPIDDDTNYTVFALKLIEVYGKAFKPNDVMEAWLSWIPMLATCTAERAAYRNAANGLLAPLTATHKNPYREWIGAQIRGDFFGYINIGNPTLASEMAWRDASISHVKNGIYGEMFIAAMTAAAPLLGDVSAVIQAGLDEIPQNCRLRRDINEVLSWHKAGDSAEQIIDKIHVAYDENTAHGWCYTNSNAMIVVMALLCGELELGKTICLAVQAAFDTDCNGATAGSIIGFMRGASQIDTSWSEPFNGWLNTSISGYEKVQIDGLVAKTIDLIHRKH